VTYTLLVDFLGEGSATQGGSTIVYEDVTNGYYDGILRYSADYFRVDYVSGDAIILPGTGSSYRENMGMALSIWDSLDTSYIYYYGYLNASIQTEFYNLLNLGKVEFQDPSAHPQNWVIGTSVDSFERIIAPGGYVEVQSSLTLDRISLSAPAAVPEPRSWVLVGSGLLIMGASAFRRS
jgi:hypothetical protein